MNGVIKFSLDWWKGRHEAPNGYFPTMEQHLNWKVYEAMPDWFLTMAEPKADDIALEIGCGYGQWMVPCARLVEAIAGIDIHPILVERSRIALAESLNALMFLSDGVAIPFTRQHFSLAYSISVFQHMPRAIVEGYLVEIARVLKLDGRALLHFRHADGEGPYSNDIVENHTGDWSVGWTVTEVRNALMIAGLTLKQFRTGDHSLIVLATL